MTGSARPGSRTPIGGAVALAAAFVAVHAVLGWINVTDHVHNPAGDVTGVYAYWVEFWKQNGVLVGVDTAWVYPIGALVPILASAAFGTAPQTYLVTWVILTTVLDAGALLLLARRSRTAAWWWLALILLIGPVVLSRLDGIAMPITVVAAVVLAERPIVATVLLTIATWIKVWPAAMLAAVLLVVRRVLAPVAAIAATSAVVIGTALAVGAHWATIGSFVTTQASRGIQVEAPVALPWLWSRALGDDSVEVYYDTGILTYQVKGGGVLEVAGLMTPVLAIGVLAVVALAIAARVRGVDPRQILAVTGLGLVAAIIALNKVGSPQYVTWYAAPIVLGLLMRPGDTTAVPAGGFRVPAVLVLVLAGLTQVIYPWFYSDVIGTQAWGIAVLTVRNLLELATLGWCLTALAGARPPIRMRTGSIPVVA